MPARRATSPIEYVSRSSLTVHTSRVSKPCGTFPRLTLIKQGACRFEPPLQPLQISMNLPYDATQPLIYVRRAR